MQNFWASLPTPIFALAPMEDVTDTVFREVVLSVTEPSALSVVFTEFTSTDGLCSERGRDNVIRRLRVNASEKKLHARNNIKLVAQIWGDDADKFRQSARLIEELGDFDGIDINMGCPVKKVVKHASCSALINFPEQAKEIVRATAEATSLPVSVKTRLGFNTIDTENWIGHLLEVAPVAITIHGRTRKMMSEGPARWDEIQKAVHLRDRMSPTTRILGNGQVSSYPDGLQKVREFGVDGVMVGTGIFRNPWLFNSEEKEITLGERFRLLEFHIRLYQTTWGNTKDYNILKRFFKIYLSGFPGAAHARDMLMRSHGYEEALSLIEGLMEEGEALLPLRHLEH